jgi:hypothetical protein
MQVQTDQHIENFQDLEERFQSAERGLDEDAKQFFKLFTESTLDGSKAAAREMKEIAARQTKYHQTTMMFYSISLLLRTDSKKLRWPNSPLRIMLQFVDANEQWADSPEELATGPTPLHHLSQEADPKDHAFHRNQVILGQQLFRHGANAYLDAYPFVITPLHLACHSMTVTNLDFIQLLLEKGASPNVQNIHGETPFMSTFPMAPGAAKFLLECSTSPTTDIDIHITTPSGGTLLGLVHYTIVDFSNQDDPRDNPEQRVKRAFLLQQWREIETMLVEVGSD